MKILVTGGAGFLGSTLVRKLIEEGHEVHIVDNLVTGKKSNLPPGHNYLFSPVDICSDNFLEVIDRDYDQIYNLACPASPEQYQKNPISVLNTCTIGMQNVLRAATRQGKPARVLQASTSEIYGDPRVSPQPEKYRGNVSTTGPRACYDEGKRVAETYCVEYNRAHKLNVKIARIFNTYGPYMAADDGRCVSNFIVAALQNKPITIYGTGRQTRSFCYVDDTIEGLVRLMNAPGFINSPINIGNDREMSITQIAKTIRDMCNSSSDLVYHDLPEDDPTNRRPDITQAKDLLGWEPKVSLEDGLQKTIAYFTEIKEVV